MADEEELDEKTKTAISKAVNAAVGDHFKRKMPSLIQDSIKSALPELTASLRDALGSQGEGQGAANGGNQQTQQPAAGQGQGAANGGNQPQQPAAPDPATQKRLADLERQLKESLERTKAAEAAARNKERDQLLDQELGKANVDAARRRGAAALLRESLVYDETSGAWKYRAQRDGYHDDLEISAGVKEWAATDEGKSYVAAAPRAGGSGQRVQGGGAPAGRQPGDQRNPKTQRQEDAMRSLSEAVGTMIDTGSISIT